VLAYTPDPTEPFSASSQDRSAYSGGVRFDHTYIPNKEHVIKTGFQVDRTQTVNQTRLFTFADDGAGNPTGNVLTLDSENRLIGYREEFWIQDQWSPNDHWTFNLGVRWDLRFQFVEEFMRRNQLVRGSMAFRGRTADLQRIRASLLFFAGRSDSIAPRAAVRAVLDAAGSRDVTYRLAPGGHMGVFAGASAPDQVWKPAAEWLAPRSIARGTSTRVATRSRRQHQARGPSREKVASHR
jgi:hypothetical protein